RERSFSEVYASAPGLSSARAPLSRGMSRTAPSWQACLRGLSAGRTEDLPQRRDDGGAKRLTVRVQHAGGSASLLLCDGGCAGLTQIDDPPESHQLLVDGRELRHEDRVRRSSEQRSLACHRPAATDDEVRG